jgi:uncharacterized protein YeaO (DUF488 family)
MMDIRLKRVYDQPDRSDGLRILVDRIWPRGVAKDDANLSHWLKGLAPSSELRKWFGHDPDKWPEFQARYLEEIKQKNVAEDLEQLRSLLETNERITLLFAARNTEHNNAVALRNYIFDGEL